MKHLSGAKVVSSCQTSGSYISVSSRIPSFLEPFDAVIPCNNSEAFPENLFPSLPEPDRHFWTKQSRPISRQTGQGTGGTDADPENHHHRSTGAQGKWLVSGCVRASECMLRRRQRGRRVTNQLIAYNQPFGHVQWEGWERRNNDQIENGVTKTGRNLKTQMGRRSARKTSDDRNSREWRVTVEATNKHGLNVTRMNVGPSGA